MHNKLLVTTVGLLLGFPTDCILAQGADVVLLFKTGEEISGELLEVRDSSLMISTLEDASEKDLSTHSAGIIAVRNERIFHVVIKGKSNMLKGMGIGTAVGGGLGALIGFASGDDPPGFLSFTASEKAGAGAIVLGGLGFLVGTVAGIASSSSDKLVEPLMNNDFSSLKPLAGYPDKEPKFLEREYKTRRKPATPAIFEPEKLTVSEKKEGPVAVGSDLLPFATESDTVQLESFPKVGFGVGLSSYSPDIGRLGSIVMAVEQKYRNQGYSIQSRRLTFNTSGFLTYSLKILVSRPVALLFEASSSTAEEGKPGNVTFKAVSGSILYHAQFSSLPWLRPYVGVGVARYRVSLGNNTAIYGTENRISPVNSNGSYTYLSSITITGNKAQTGVSFSAGIELAAGRTVALNLFGTYARIPDVQAVATEGERATLKLSSFQLGARAMLYF
jgi:hypothetical protein